MSPLLRALFRYGGLLVQPRTTARALRGGTTTFCSWTSYFRLLSMAYLRTVKAIGS